MLDVKIAGPGCRNCQELENRVKKALLTLQAEATVTKVTDFKEIAALGVMMTPGLVVNGKVLSQGKLPSEETVRTLLGNAAKG